MKKLLSLLLCLCMIMSFVPSGVVMAESTESDESTSQEVLDMFGFKPDPDSYDTNALKPGTHPIEPKYDFYLDTGSTVKKGVTTIKWSILNALTKSFAYKNSTTVTDAFTGKESKPYFVSTAFSASGTGINNLIAKVYFEYGASCGNIFLSIYDAEGNALVKGHNTGGYVVTTDQLEMWEVEGLLSVTAGDFDGDGIDELAVYTPNNADETSSGSVHNHVTVGIFEFDPETNTVSTKQYIDLTSKASPDEICEWEYSYNGSKKQFYCIPYVALNASDVNSDDTDDLFAVVSFSTWFRGAGGKDKYSTATMIDHNKNFASVLEAYEGTKGGKLKQSIKHRVLVTEALKGGASNANTENRFILRNANVTFGDITGDGTDEIIIGGNYTRANVADTNSGLIVTSNRFVEVDGEHALCHIVGYTSYENLKKKNTYDKNTDYQWVVQRTGNGWTYWYNEDNTDSGPITVSLAAYKHNGAGLPDTVFIGGQLFDYDNESATLKFTSNYDDSSFSDSSGSSVVWIGKAVTGNVADTMYGRETLMFPYYYKVSGKDNYNCILASYSQGISSGSKTGKYIVCTSGIQAFADSKTQKVVSVALLDGGGKSSYITYGGNNTDVYFSNIEVLAIMQAPPLYEELNDDTYIGNSATGFAKSTGSSEGISHGGSLTAGVVAGFEQETSFLGLFKVAGAEYELSITGTVSYDHSTETTYDYSTGFETAGTTDTVVVFTVPYVRYNCTMYVPEYKLPTEADYNSLCKFRDELTNNLAKFTELGEDQAGPSYGRGCEYYLYKYDSCVDENNFQDQYAVLYKVEQEIDFIEKAIAQFNKGGTGNWGDVVEGAVLPYHYSVPQQPMVTTVDVATYDAIAEMTPGLEKIYGNVFHEDYHAGDPNSYAHSVGDLNATGTVLQSKQSIGSSEDGFLTNSNVSSAGSVQSQTISVEKSTSDELGWGAAIENTSVANVGGAKVGFTVTAEYNGSSVKTSTEGNEYSGAVVGLPAGTPADYSYAWKLVSYNAKLNGGKVPVVGYITRITTTAPPSIAQNISVEDVTDSSATINWEDGARPADFYKLSRVYIVNGSEQTTVIGNNITSEDGTYSYTIDGLTSANTSYYILESYTSNGKSSVPTDKIIITTFPKDFSADIIINGFDSNVIYQNGKTIKAAAKVTGNDGYDTLYQWQINDGSGWEDISNKTTRIYSQELSPLDNGNSIRCSAVIFISDTSSCVIYSDPLTMRCGKSDAGYNVDWDADGKSVTVTSDEGATPANVYVKSENANGITKIMNMPASTDGATFDLTDFGDDTVRLYIWDYDLKPLTYQFER